MAYRAFLCLAVGALALLSPAAWAELIIETTDGRTIRVPVSRSQVTSIRFTESGGQAGRPPAKSPARVKGWLRLDKTVFSPGETIRVRFTAPPSYPSTAWVGIVPANISHGSEARNDQHDLTYQYMDRRTQGTLVFKAPPKPGRYDFRMNDNDDSGKETAFVTFVVQ